MIFRDRIHGGELLAAKLEAYRAERPIVLGLARGGVPVALEVARRLGAPLEVMVVRKIGAPFQREYAMGAIAEGGGVYVNSEAAHELGFAKSDIAALAKPEEQEVARRVALYRGGRPLPDLTGRTVLLVDDGVATGATARAACRSARARGAGRVVLAAPVIAARSEPELRGEFDDLIAVDLPWDFIAVGSWYRDFPQVSDDEVLACLQRGAEPQTMSELWDGEWNESEEEEDATSRPLLEPEKVRVRISGLSRGEGLEGFIAMPPEPRGLVVFVHGSGSSRLSPRNQWVARVFQRRGLGTLLFDLLTPEEAEEDERTMQFRFDIELLARRVVDVTTWAGSDSRTRQLPLGYFGASTGAAAALEAAAVLPDRVAAIVSRGGRPDLVSGSTLRKVTAPVLLLVGARDEEVLELNRSAASELRRAQIVVVPGATHLFEEPGALAAVAQSAASWFVDHFSIVQGPSDGLGNRLDASTTSEGK